MTQNLPKIIQKLAQNKLFLILICLLLLMIFSFLILQTKPKIFNNPNNSNKIKFVASFFPLFDFAQNVGGDLIQIENITHQTDPHEFEPTIQDLTKIYNSNFFIYQGAGFDTWANKITTQIKTEKPQIKIINMTSNFELMAEKNEEKVSNETSQTLQNNSSNSVQNNSKTEKINYNPHIWLDPIKVITQAQIIRDGLIQIDSKNKEIYEANAQNYIKKLQNLDQKYKTELQNCRQKTIIAPHDAYIYLAKRYNFQTLSIVGLEPSSEPTIQEITSIIQAIKDQKLKYIFYEKNNTPKFAQTIASETGVQSLILDSIESPDKEQIEKGENYVTIMEKNLENLKIALECK
jgi:zinc transport system substrate-binding protein